MSAPHRDLANDAACLAGGGEAGATLRGRDWAATPLGPVAEWPAPLRAAVALALASPYPAFLVAGPDFNLLYNDAGLPLLGNRHPAAAARPCSQAWPELWAAAGALLEDVFATGRSARSEDLPFSLQRDGYLEEFCFSFGFSPIRSDDGKAVLGVYCTAHESPDQVLGRRRAAVMRHAAGNGHTPAPERRKVARRPRVLLAADNADTRDYLHRLLGERYDVEALADGQTALAAARRAPPDLLLLDATLPNLDGPAVVRALRAEIGTRVGPAILLCARGDEPWRLKGDGGADDFLVKPFGARELLARVEAHLKIDRLRREAAGRESALRAEAESRQRLLARVLAGVSDGFVALDREWRYTYVNPRAAEVAKMKPAEMLGRTIWELFPAVVGTEMETGCRRAVATCEVQRFEYYYPPLDRWYEQRLYPTPDGLTIFSTDITDSKRGEQALQESQDRFRQLAEAMPQFVWVADPAGRIEYINGQWCKFAGLSLEDFQAQGQGSVVHFDDLSRVREQWAECVAAVVPYETEMRVRRADGAYRWILVRALPIRDAAGRLRHWFGTGTDIDERKREEQAVRGSEQLFRAVFESSGTGIVLADARTFRYLRVNRKYCELTGYSEQELLQLSFPEITHPDDRARDLELFGRVLAGETPGYTVEKRYLRRDRKEIWVRIDVAVVRDAGGAPLHSVAVVQEITAAKRAETALREADRRKDEFLATLAHELRNPLAPIRNAVQVLRLLEPPGPDVRHACGVIGRQVEHLSRLVDDLLDVSRITRGRIELRRERVEVAAVVERALETSRPLIEASGHRLTVSLPAEPLWLDADPTRLAQVMSNLLNNAAKYTGRGGEITLTAEAHREPGRPGEASIRVCDTGVGIPADMMARIFEMFTQVDTSLERAQGGLGIGLTVVQRLVEMHGGSVSAHSGGSGAGSEFTVRLPLAAAPAAGTPSELRPPAEQPTATGLRILVVDDSRDSADTLAQLLRLLRHDVRTAYDGPSGLAAATAFRPDVVLLDIGMPGMSGYEIAAQLRQRPETRGAILAAMTGYGQDEDRRRSAEAGFDRHFVKPIDLVELKTLLRGLKANC